MFIERSKFTHNVGKVIIFMIFLSFIFASNAFFTSSLAQTATPVDRGIQNAVLKGTISDQNGSIVPGAKIILTGKQKFEVLSKFDGSYTLQIPPGIYKIRIENDLMGFHPTLRSSAYMKDGEVVEIDFILFSRSVIIESQEVAEKKQITLDHLTLGPFKFDTIKNPISSSDHNIVKEIGIRYGNKEEVGDKTIYTAYVFPDIKGSNGNKYPGIHLTYDLSSIQAESIEVHKNGVIIAEGSVTISKDKKEKQYFDYVQVEISDGAFTIRDNKPVTKKSISN